MRRPTSFIAFALALGAIACGGARTPQATVAAYERALRHDDAASALALTTAEYRAATPRERFVAEFDRRVAAGRSLRDQLAVAAEADAVLTASIPYSRYESVSLGFIDGQWRITGGVADMWDRSTPRAAVVAFVRAVTARDARGIVGLVPAEFLAHAGEAEIEQWLVSNETELTEMVALIEAELDQPIVAAGDSAIFHYGDASIRLRRENGGWVIVDFN